MPRAARLYLAAAQCLIEASRTRPVVLVMDDLHWADEPTIELLGYLATTLGAASHVEPVRVMLIATMREADATTPVNRRGY